MPHTAKTIRLDVYTRGGGFERGAHVCRYHFAPNDTDILDTLVAIVLTGDRVVEVRLLGAADGDGPFENTPNAVERAFGFGEI